MKKVGILLVGISTILMTNCSGAKETLGFTRNSPDEYTALERPPLSMPPSYHLHAPQSSAAQDHSTRSSQRVQAASAFLGEEIEIYSSKPTKQQSGESAMLNLAGADHMNDNIRYEIDKETQHLIKKDERFTDKLIFWQKQKEPASIVNPMKEHKRIEQNKAAHKPVNEGSTKPIEDHKKAPLEGLL